MTNPTYDPQWLRTLRAGAIVPPLRPRVPLWAGESVIGSVEPGFFHKLSLHAMKDGDHPLLKEEHPSSLGWR
jgi:hypothetical protein